MLLELALQRAPVGDVLEVARADAAPGGAAGPLWRPGLRPPLKEGDFRGVDHVGLDAVEGSRGELVEVCDLDDVCK